MASNHVHGVVKMVELNGGPQALGLDGFLAHLFRKFVADSRLRVQVGGPSPAACDFLVGRSAREGMALGDEPSSREVAVA